VTEVDKVIVNHLPMNAAYLSANFGQGVGGKLAGVIRIARYGPGKTLATLRLELTDDGAALKTHLF
jgi:hypothetical protein